MPKQTTLYIEFPTGIRFKLQSGRQYLIEQDGDDFTVLSWSAKGSKRELLARSYKECAEIICKLEFRQLRANSEYADPFKSQTWRTYNRIRTYQSHFTAYSEE